MLICHSHISCNRWPLAEVLPDKEMSFVTRDHTYYHVIYKNDCNHKPTYNKFTVQPVITWEYIIYFIFILVWSVLTHIQAATRGSATQCGNSFCNEPPYLTSLMNASSGLDFSPTKRAGDADMRYISGSPLVQVMAPRLFDHLSRAGVLLLEPSKQTRI